MMSVPSSVNAKAFETLAKAVEMAAIVEVVK